MNARIRKSMQEKDQGFTLIELLVVMIIIGILSAIAIPVFLNQRKKAEDTATKADVSTIGKELATYFVDNTATPAPAISLASGRWVLTPGAAAGVTVTAVDLGKASNNVALVGQSYTSATDWCVSLKNDEGDKAKVGFKYSAKGGLEPGTC